MPGTYWDELQDRLLDVNGRRLKLMDEHGIETMILSLNAPAVQAIPERARAIEVAQRANDALAEQCLEHPDRFRAFAALPLQDPDAAAAELRRCVTEHGFVGALVNGFSQDESVGDGHEPLYYDLPRYRPFWAEVAELDVPFYLHPRNPLPEDARIYADHPWLLGPTWAFAQETAVHALRLMASGLFDEHPSLKIVLGHMGEGIPAMLWRIDNRNAWVEPPPDLSRQAEVGPLLHPELLPHDIRKLQNPISHRRDPRGRGRPHHVLHRLALREHRPRRQLVRQRFHLGERPAQDRSHERGLLVRVGPMTLESDGFVHALRPCVSYSGAAHSPRSRKKSNAWGRRGFSFSPHRSSPARARTCSRNSDPEPPGCSPAPPCTLLSK